MPGALAGSKVEGPPAEERISPLPPRYPPRVRREERRDWLGRRLRHGGAGPFARAKGADESAEWLLALEATRAAADGPAPATTATAPIRAPLKARRWELLSFLRTDLAVRPTPRRL